MTSCETPELILERMPQTFMNVSGIQHCMRQVGVNLSKISAIQNEEQNQGRDRDETLIGKLVSDYVAGMKGLAKTVCCQIMFKLHFQI